MHKRGVLALVITSILWSSGGVLIKLLPLSALTIAGARSAIAAVVMLLWLRRPKPIWTPAQFGSIICYALTVVLFVSATKLTSAANAIFLQYTAPIWVALLSVFITKERLTRIDVLAVLAVMAGMAVFFVERVSSGYMLGNIIAVCSGAAFAGVAMFMRAQRGVSTTESIMMGNILAAVVCIPFLEPFPFQPDIIIGLVLMGALQLGVSYIIYSWAMAHVTAIEAILITTLEPLLNPVWVAMFYGEMPSQTALIGGFIVIAAVVARNFAHAQHLQRIARTGTHS